MNHFHEEKKAKAFLFFLWIMKFFIPLIIITTSINTTFLPPVMTFNILAMLHPLEQNNLETFFSELLIQNFGYKFRSITSIGSKNMIKFGFFSININTPGKTLLKK